MIQKPPQIGPDFIQWGRQLTRYLQQNLSKLGFKTAADNPSENGIILWDEVNKYPVVSKNGEWRQIVLEDGQYSGGVTADVTAAAINTAYPLTYTTAIADGITQGTPASRLVFEEAGTVHGLVLSADFVNVEQHSQLLVLASRERRGRRWLDHEERTSSERLSSCCEPFCDI